MSLFWVIITVAVVGAVVLAIGAYLLQRSSGLPFWHRFSLDDRKFGDAVLARMPDGELKRLLALGEWKTMPAGTVLTEEGKPVAALIYLALGKAEVFRSGESVATMSTGRFVGDMTCMTGEPATATVRLLTRTRLLKLPAQQYRDFVAKHPEVREHMQQALARDIGRKMTERMRREAGQAEAQADC